MAPEAFDGKRNEQTDIWSVGVIFYQLLAGHLPYREEDITSLVGAILMRNPEPLPREVPKPLQNVIARALAKDANIRYKSAAEMRAALRNPHETDPNFQPEKSILTVVSPSVNTLPPQSFHPPTEKKSNPPHLIYAIAGLLAIVIVVGLIGINYLSISPKKSADAEAAKVNAEKTTATTTSTPVASNNGGRDNNTTSVPANCVDKGGVWHCTTPVEVPTTDHLTFESDGPIDISYGDITVHSIPGKEAKWRTPKKTDTVRTFKKPAGAKNEVTLRIFPLE